MSEYIFFWNQPKGTPRAVFNQWYMESFEYRGFTFACAEQAMMAMKAIHFHDIGTLAQILECTNPRAVKALGREVKNYNDTEWDRVRFGYVTEINIAKFWQNKVAREELLSTGTQTLVEASPVDCIWGIGMAEDHPDVNDVTKWKGRNLLGHALMEARRVISRAIELNIDVQPTRWSV